LQTNAGHKRGVKMDLKNKVKKGDFVVKVKKKNLLIILAVIAIIAIVFTVKPYLQKNKISIADSSDIIVLNDLRCKECDVASVITQLKSVFPDFVVGEIDYMDEEGKKIYGESDLTVLPAILFKDNVKDNANYTQVENYLEQKGDFLSLRIGASFDPAGEVCDNEIDDNDNGKTDCEDESCKTNPACMETICNDGKDDDGDGLVDCDDPDCEKSWQCMPKTDKPEVELFVMSYCPYGTQIEKGMLPAARLLGDKIDFSVKFVYYAMHGEKEVNEQTLQYCIQKEYNNKYLDYLECFLEEGDTEGCLEEVSLTGKLNSCIENTDKEFKITEKLNDESTWLGSYPPFDIDKKLNEEYGVSGSPTLIINGVKASVSRDPASLLDAICTGFKVKPAECSEELSSENPSAGFGFSETAASTSSGSCG